MKQILRRVSRLESVRLQSCRVEESAALKLLSDEELDRRLATIMHKAFGDDLAASQDFQRQTLGFVVWPEADFDKLAGPATTMRRQQYGVSDSPEAIDSRTPACRSNRLASQIDIAAMALGRVAAQRSPIRLRRNC